MNEKERIFGRIKEALQREAPKPGSHDGLHAIRTDLRSQPFSRWLPAVGGDVEEWITAFEKASVDLRTSFHLVANAREAESTLKAICADEAWKRIASHRGALTEPACAALGLPALLTDDSYDVNEMEKCDAGITECDALVAQTGSVVVTARSAGGRALSVLPPHHVVLARRDQLLADLPSAFKLVKEKYGSDYPSFISFITGPSRTGDIERILVLGAHGPRRLTVICH